MRALYIRTLRMQRVERILFLRGGAANNFIFTKTFLQAYMISFETGNCSGSLTIGTCWPGATMAQDGAETAQKVYLYARTLE